MIHWVFSDSGGRVIARSRWSQLFTTTTELRVERQSNTAMSQVRTHTHTHIVRYHMLMQNISHMRRCKISISQFSSEMSSSGQSPERMWKQHVCTVLHGICSF